MARSRVGGDLLFAVPIILLALTVPRLAATAGLEPPATFPPGQPGAKLATAAAGLEAALGSGGSGFRFEIVQSQTLVAKPGQKIEVPDPADRSKSLGLVDELVITSLVERGAATAAGFWSELRTGPEPGDSPRYDGGRRLFGAIAKGDSRWRDDGHGWYETDLLPGIGLDPRTVARLPALLREATAPSEPVPASDAGRPIEKLAATGRVPNIPGVVASDGEAFTALAGPIEFGLDTEGRLATLRIVARNTTETVHELRVETHIRFLYTDVGPLPAPEPAYVAPTPTPTPDIPWPPGFTPPPGLFPIDR